MYGKAKSLGPCGAHGVRRGKAKSLGPCGAHGVRRACMGRLRVWDHVEPMVSGVHVWEG